MSDTARDSAIRQRTVARALIRAAMLDGGIDATAAVNADLGRFVGLRAGSALWLSARLEAGETAVSTPAATGVLGTALSAVAQSRLRGEAPIEHITIVGDAGTLGVVARQAAYFSLGIKVVEFDGASFADARPADHLSSREPSSAHLTLADVIREAGADVVVEHGVVAGEVNGLEVVRVVDEDGVAKLRIGVGIHDRETFRMLHGDEVSVEQLRDVVQQVARHRATGAAAHPLNRLAPERALRAEVIAAPHRLDARSMRTAEPPVARTNLKDSVPCVATATLASGEDAVVVFTAGVMVDAVPFAADARDRLNRLARLIVVAEPRNVLPTQQHLATMLLQPAVFMSA